MHQDIHLKSIQKIIPCKYIIYIFIHNLNIFTYIQHLYTAFVLCKCVLTYIFSNYYKINKEGRTRVCLESDWGMASTQWVREGGVVACGCPLLRKHSSFPGMVLCQPYKSLHMCQIGLPLFTPLIRIYKWRRIMHSGGTASLLSVSRFLALSRLGTGRHVRSCCDTAVYVWILRQAGFIRHGVWRKHRIVP